MGHYLPEWDRDIDEIEMVETLGDKDESATKIKRMAQSRSGFM